MGDRENIAAFAVGWKRWVRFGRREDCAGPFMTAGFDAAALYNDYGGGPRPKTTDAQEFAESWFRAGMPTSETAIRKWLHLGGA